MEPIDFVGEILDALTAVQIPFMLVGSFSTNIYGLPRSTKDADFVVQLDSAKLNPLIAKLKANYKFDDQMTFETVTSTMRYRLKHRQTAFLIELFELSSDSHDQTRFKRRVALPFAGRTAFLPTPEDVIITKLRWSKSPKRQKDIEDVENVIAVQHQRLDLSYIREWCDLHGTRQVFDKLYAENSSG